MTETAKIVGWALGFALLMLAALGVLVLPFLVWFAGTDAPIPWWLFAGWLVWAGFLVGVILQLDERY